MYKVDTDTGSTWLANKMVASGLWPSKLLYRAHYGSLEALVKEGSLKCRVDYWNPQLESLGMVIEIEGKLEKRHFLVEINQNGRLIRRCFLNDSGDVLPVKPKARSRAKAKVEA